MVTTKEKSSFWVLLLFLFTQKCFGTDFAILRQKIPGWDFSKKAFYHTLTTEVLQSFSLSFSAILAKHNLTKPKYVWVFVKILLEK
jgi:hypothetical protein